MGKKSLAETHPELAKQWHPRLNSELTPNDVTSGSNKKVWWKCNKGEDHEWDAAVSSRASGSGCAICSGYRVVKSNCLSTTHPEIAKQWHPKLNGDLTPDKVTSGTHKKVWWKCDKGEDHEWPSKVSNRTFTGNKCAVCSGHRVVKSNCLSKTHPELANQWHPTKNKDLTPDKVTSGTHKKVWWKCDKGEDHEWPASPANRKITACPFCSGNKVSKTNSLKSSGASFINEWNYELNGNLTPDKISFGSNKKIWWNCTINPLHIYSMSPKDRAKNRNCSYCSGHLVHETTSLQKTHPEIAKQWHSTKNGDLTPNDVTSGSNKKVWWKCNKGEDHEWPSMIGNISIHKQGCPFCTLTPQSKQELTISFELMKLFGMIDPKGLKIRLRGKLRAIDIFIPKLNLCIEFDGAYWHKEKRDIDKIKSEMLFKEGFKLIRVREEPLKKIYDTDVISKLPYDGKIVTNDILSMILSTYNLDNKLAAKIREYQSKDGLQNEKGLENYIDRILTEKAEKKKSQ